MKDIDKITLSLVCLKYFCNKKEKLEKIDDLENLN